MWQNAKQRGVEVDVANRVIEHDPLAYCQFEIVDRRVVAMEEHPVEGISFFASGEQTAVDMLRDGLTHIRYVGTESSVDRILLQVNGDK